MKKYGFIIVVVFFIGANVQAGLFDFNKKKKKDVEIVRQSNVVKRYHLTIPDKKTEKELISLIRGKRVLGDDVRTLRRLIMDRKARFETLQKQLKEKYGILPEERYKYLPEERALCKITLAKVPEKKEVSKDVDQKDEAPDAANQDAEVNTDESPVTPEQKVFLKFKSDEEAQGFINIQTRKSQRGQEVMVFQRTMMEQEVQMKKIMNIMSKKFAMKEDRYYDYDSKSMRLYEVTPRTPRGSSVKK